MTNGQMFIDLHGDKAPGITDGMRVDSRGNIYTTGPGGIWIVSPEGTHLEPFCYPKCGERKLRRCGLENALHRSARNDL